MSSPLEKRKPYKAVRTTTASSSQIGRNRLFVHEVEPRTPEDFPRDSTTSSRMVIAKRFLDEKTDWPTGQPELSLADSLFPSQDRLIDEMYLSAPQDSGELIARQMVGLPADSSSPTSAVIAETADRPAKILTYI
jgi:hypothetical protein